MIRRLLVGGTSLAAALVLTLPATGAEAAGPSSGAPAATANMSQSNNWSGYSEGILDSLTPYQSISASWVVPTATQHTAGQAESSATWIGIGGGCLNSSCLAGDETLVQAGTEQDVAANGQASYYAWWEIVPVPSIQFTTLKVNPGDTIKASLTQTLPEVWNIVLTDVSSGQSTSVTQTIPYPSDYSTAEFIEETPLAIGTSGTGITSMPDLGTVGFSNAEVNGANANLQASDALQLVSSSGQVLATPSAPVGGDSFNDCTYATSCAAP